MTIDGGPRSRGSVMSSAYENVARALESGATLADIEGDIEREPLSPDARAAVWLYAWVISERGGAGIGRRRCEG
jgi:hypothetical protein